MEKLVYVIVNKHGIILVERTTQIYHWCWTRLFKPILILPNEYGRSNRPKYLSPALKIFNVLISTSTLFYLFTIPQNLHFCLDFLIFIFTSSQRYVMTSFLLFLFYDNHFLRRKSKLHLIMPFRKEDILTVDFILILSRCKM